MPLPNPDLPRGPEMCASGEKVRSPVSMRVCGFAGCVGALVDAPENLVPGTAWQSNRVSIAPNGELVADTLLAPERRSGDATRRSPCAAPT
jgi:hypothetical protein